MFELRRSGERGHLNYGWLDTYHTFSFGGYHDPKHNGFGPLRVINQDTVAPKEGFGTHGHDNMEIISYVLSGVLEHEDSSGTVSRLEPGDVQLMSAGSGITHSEYNGSDSRPLEFLQIWIIPSERNTAPGYQERTFSMENRSNRLCLIASPTGEDASLVIKQDVRVYASVLDSDRETKFEVGSGRASWLHLARGSLLLNGKRLEAGDGASLNSPGPMIIQGVKESEFLFFDLPEVSRDE